MIVAGLDEVGRGALAGPLTVCAASFQIEGPWRDGREATVCPILGVKDSKAFTSHAARQQVAARLEQHVALVDHQYAQIEATAINVHGMAWALRTAFERAVNALTPAPDLVLVDGNAGISGWSGPQQHKPKGDSLWWPVSAASVLAKVYRDDLMDLLDDEFPAYGWKSNKGYGTAAHIAALQQHGASALHRTQFVATALHTAAGKR